MFYTLIGVLFTDKKLLGGNYCIESIFPPIYPHDEHRFLEYPGAVGVHRMRLLSFLMGSHLH